MEDEPGGFYPTQYASQGHGVRDRRLPGPRAEEQLGHLRFFGWKTVDVTEKLFRT